MKKILFLAILASAAPALAQNAAVTAASFAHHADITLGGAAPFHQLVLPLAVYQGLERDDLGDLRVFNGKGEMVPYTLLRQREGAAPAGPEVAAPLFPIVARGAGDAGNLSLQVSRRGDDTLVAVAAPATAPSASVVRGVIVDISKLRRDSAVNATVASAVRYTLRLDTGAGTASATTATSTASATNAAASAAGAATATATAVPAPATPAFQSFTLESSDDLQHWNTIKNDAQLVHMEHNGQRIDRDSVSWDGATGKYLRLSWATPEQAPAVSAALLSVTALAGLPAPLVWSAALAPQSSAADHYDYALPGHMPLELLRVGLAQTNTLAPVTVQRYLAAPPRHRRDGDGYWQALAGDVVFRLQGPNGDMTSPDIRLDQPPATRLRLLVDQRGGGIGQQAPTLQVGFTPAVLVFLARGEGPFKLAWGAPKVVDAALAPSMLMPNYQSGQPLTAALATLQAVAMPAPAPGAAADTESGPASKGVLWAVLVAGVLVLGGMATLLLKQMKRGDGA